MAASARLTIRLLGEIEIARGGERLSLPASKKTRALLAYLAVTAKPHRRERLCELLWDMPDDPRGALRWSLSKLRALVDEPGRARISGGRETVGLDAVDADIDLIDVRRRLTPGEQTLSEPDLGAAAALFRGEFLEGLDLPNCPEFAAWRAAEREDARALHRRLLVALAARLSDRPNAALPHVRALTALDPYAVDAHALLLRTLAAAGRLREAEEQFAVSTRTLGEASANSARALAEAWRDLNRAAPVPAEAARAPVASVGEPSEPTPDQRRSAMQRSQTIRFCTAADTGRASPTPPPATARPWSRPPIGSTTSNTTGTARCGGTGSTSSPATTR